MNDVAQAPREAHASAGPAFERRKPIKLIIQIPCFNEEESLPETLSQLPRHLAGVDVVEWLVIDDGSTDHTVEVARANGVDHIWELPGHFGLARAFMTGLKRAIELDADIVVNTDADNQYDAADIPALIAPLLSRRAELVVGARPISTIESFSPLKRLLQRVGSAVVRFVSGTKVADVPSGFRAFSREAALRLNVFDPYTYTLETVIEAGLSGIVIVSVPISVNHHTRPSRLVRSNLHYIGRAIRSILRSFFIYKPGRTFFLLGAVPGGAGLALAVRWIVLSVLNIGGTHVPSLVAAAVLVMLAALMWVVALLGELFAINRRLLQDIQYTLRRNGGDARRLAQELLGDRIDDRR